MEDEIRVFLSSPQSFEPVDQKGNFKNIIIRKKKRKTRSRKLLIRNILIEEDFSKLTVRQQILNTKFRTTVKSSNDISLINSGIDLVEYNINNKNNLENYLKGTKKDTMEGNMAINRPSRKKRKLEEDVVLGHKYYKTLYEDSLKSPKSVNKRLLKIKLNKIESDTEKIFFLRLPVINETPEEENKYILRLPLSEEKEILPVLCLKLPVYRKKNKITKWIWLPKPTVETQTIRKECYIPKGPFALYGEILSTIPALLYEEESKILPLESQIDCFTDVHDHKEIRNCLVKFTLYIEIIQEYLKFHHCELVDSLLKHLKIILERINDCKCMCEIEKELIDVFQRIEDCKDCISPMLDINLIRQNETRELIVESEKKRFKDHSKVFEIYNLDVERIKVNFELDLKNKNRNIAQKKVRDAYKNSKNIPKEEIQILVDQFKEAEREALVLQDKLKILDLQINCLLKGIGNIVDKRVVVSKSEENNEIISTFRSARALCKAPKPYSILMGDYTFSTAGAKVVGHRGYYLSGRMAKLGSTLSSYAIDFLEEKGYTLIQPPVMMRKEIMAKTSQLSDFDDQLYKVEDDLYLIATSEQSLSALHMDERLTDSDLPKLYAGQSLCFRKEAGAHGKDNAGLFRIHQFEKIEQFVICKPEESESFHNRMIKLSEEFYKSLDVSFNVVSIVSGELNDAASLKYDLEAYFPSFDKYRELVSCSNCTDYQSRELEVRYGITKENNKKVYVHMLNGTLCAVQRTLCCIVENYQEDGKIIVPAVLRKYTGFDAIDLN